MKQKLLLALLALFTLGGSNLFAQTDVTSTYLKNPSFEKDGVITASNGALTLTGWTQSDPTNQYNNTGCYDAETNIPTQGTVTVTPSDGSHFLFFRKGWAQNAYTFTTSEASKLPKGAYTLSVDYKMVEGYDDKQNNKTSVTISALNGETTLGSATGTTKTNVSGGNAYTYLNTAEWSTVTTNFTIEEETNTTFVITLQAGGQRRSDFVIDNVRLLQTEFIDPTAVELSASTLEMIVTGKKTLTATFTPADANHNTAITWASSEESVATVVDGVVTAVATGTATITATTANGLSATCTVTVNEAPLANGDYYILNVSKNKYLGGANSWGTQASVIEHGIPFTVALADGAYTLDSKTYNNSATAHYLTGTYVDGAATSIYITDLGDGKYSISTAEGSAYLTANDENTVVANTASDATSELAQWKFVTKDDRDALLNDATEANPADATYNLVEANISRNLRKAYETKGWSGDYSYGGADSNQCAERYKATTNVYQTISVPNGKYTVSAQGFFRQESGSAISYLYANDESVALHQIQSGGINSMSAASEAFTNGEYKNELVVNVTDGTLTVGIKCDAATNWTIWDNFELYYYGPTIGSEAVELANPMEAGKWYYFDLGVDGTYNLTANTLSDIVYTNNGIVLIENEGTVTTQFAGAENQSLTAGRYYVKSSSEQTFSIAPASYDYNLGEAVLSTADGGYTQSSTFTVTFPNAATNDPVTALAFVENSKATVNGAEVALTAVEKGFTFELGTIAANTDFVIEIPANVYGYADHSMNEAINITIHTPAVLDGTYFVRTADYQYISRGSSYNTRAVVDEFGLPLTVATDGNGITQFTFVDNNKKLFDAGSTTVYTDDTTNPNWTIQNTEGGFYIVNANDNGSKNQTIGIVDGNLQSNNGNVVWTFEALSQHNIRMEALKDIQAANAAATLGNEEITTKADLATWLDENYSATSVTVDDVTFTEKWNGNASAEWGAGKDMYTATVTDLPEGLYKLTVNAYYRLNGSATAAEGARANVYLYGNDVKTQLYSLKDFPAAEAWPGRNQSDADGYYPDDFESGTAATTADNYLTELYVYISDGTLNYGIHQPSRFSNGQWFGFQNFTLTRYDAPANITIKAERQYTAFSYDKPLDFTNSELTAEIVTSAAGTTKTVTKVPANTGIIVGLAEATTEAKTIQVPVCSGETDDVSANMLVAVLEATTIQQTADGYTNYVFGKSGGKEQFFKVRAAGMEVPANNAYLAISDAEAKGLDVIGFGEDATGINAIKNVDMQNDDVYNLQGQKVNRAQKGVYIVNGKKIVIK